MTPDKSKPFVIRTCLRPMVSVVIDKAHFNCGSILAVELVGKDYKLMLCSASGSDCPDQGLAVLEMYKKSKEETEYAPKRKKEVQGEAETPN